ncbi:ATP-dependent RNA helicase DbpA [Kineobactrum salinum]|uniref:ATP-dependent RNA helicase DbpA n=1 Tax=Kineobactrum salinum TaxID=2708301 RepID=A0A6C0U349_9GAMM|nr:ATP-dependent RNA helicase DbpA [Kineobactrum salinum]QIB66446.1 ATP-dependent RNA helicase DbpA [Kineobactrum salinum]
MNSFDELPLDPALRDAVELAGYVTPTPIQAGTLPAILAGRDVLAQAPTGSGKTAAFGLGLLQRLDVSTSRTQALVLCPTRELADQVARELRRLAVGIPNVKLTLLTGGISPGPQLASLAHAPHIVVGTPGRVQKMLHQQALDPAAIALLVLDEADRMLDMGFEEAIREIVDQLPAKRQSLLFSATWPASIRAIGRSALRDPLEVSVAASGEQPVVEQWFHELGQQADKPAAVAGLLLQHRPESTVVFCNTRRDVDELVVALARFGVVSAALHGDLEQRERDEVLLRFANRSLNVLVASDVAARGLDVKELACVINYELPGDPDIYLHRIGRTARAGSGGLALNLVSPREAARVLQLEDRHGLQPRWAGVSPAVAGAKRISPAGMSTLRIEAGRSDKLRPGDVLGALTGPAGLEAAMIGKIDIFPKRAYVAVRCDQAQKALAGLRAGGIKGRKFRVSAM